MAALKMTTGHACAEGPRSRWPGTNRRTGGFRRSPALPARSRRARGPLSTAAGLGAAVAVACLATFWSATPASAHNSLIASSPGNGAVVESGPQQIQLTFDQPVQNGQGLNTVAVLGPNNDHWEGESVQVAGNVVTAPIRTLGPAGAYRIGYRVLSADGHPVSGELTFTLSKAGNGTPAPAGQQQAAPDAPAPDSDSGVPVWVWIAGAGVLLAAGLALAMRMGGKAQQ